MIVVASGTAPGEQAERPADTDGGVGDVARPELVTASEPPHHRVAVGVKPLGDTGGVALRLEGGAQSQGEVGVCAGEIAQ
nr:hypothetical protein [Streptomyces sp. CS227]